MDALVAAVIAGVLYCALRYLWAEPPKTEVWALAFAFAMRKQTLQITSILAVVLLIGAILTMVIDLWLNRLVSYERIVAMDEWRASLPMIVKGWLPTTLQTAFVALAGLLFYAWSSASGATRAVTGAHIAVRSFLWLRPWFKRTSIVATVVACTTFPGGSVVGGQGAIRLAFMKAGQGMADLNEASMSNALVQTAEDILEAIVKSYTPSDVEALRNAVKAANELKSTLDELDDDDFPVTIPLDFGWGTTQQGTIADTDRLGQRPGVGPNPEGPRTGNGRSMLASSATKVIHAVMPELNLDIWSWADTPGATGRRGESAPPSRRLSRLQVQLPSTELAVLSQESASYTPTEIANAAATARSVVDSTTVVDEGIPEELRTLFMDSTLKLLSNEIALDQVKAALEPYPITRLIFDAVTDELLKQARKKLDERARLSREAALAGRAEVEPISKFAIVRGLESVAVQARAAAVAYASTKVRDDVDPIGTCQDFKEPGHFPVGAPYTARKSECK